MGYFLLFYPPDSPKKENLKKWRKKITWKYHHFTQVYLKSWLHAIMFLRYGVWQVQLLFFILGYFFLFHPPSSPKNENFKKKEKSTWRYHHFKHIYRKIMIIYNTVPEIWHVTNLIVFFSFWAIFCSFRPQTAQKIKIKKK